MRGKRLKFEGFTLIELLVVIAIIGILSLIVFTNINTVRNRAKDAGIIANMNSLKLVGEIYLEEHGNYGAFCNDSRVETIFDAISSPKKYKYCHHDSDQWAVCAQLNIPEDRSKAWCLDSTGTKKQINQSDCVASITFCL